MSKSAVVFDLPPEMIGEGVLPYLSIKDMRSLNTTNKSLRLVLSSVWKSFQYDRLNETLRVTDIMWMLGVGMQISALNMRISARKKSYKSTIWHDELSIISQRIPKLKKIAINCCHPCGDRLRPLLSFHELEVLRLTGGVGLNVASLLNAHYCHTLHTLYIEHNIGITDNVIRIMCETYPHILHIDLRHCRRLTNSSVVHIANRLPQLQSIDISMNHDKITDVAVIAVAEHCAQLISLSIDGCDKISDAALIALGQQCHGLKSIGISDIGSISDVGVSALAAGCPLLQKFIAKKTNITDAGVIALTRRCRDLRKIDMCRCDSIGLGAVTSIAENCPLISKLYLSNCSSLDDACLYVIAEHCRNLIHIDVSARRNISVNAIDAIIGSCKKVQSITCFNNSVGGNPSEWLLLHQKYRQVSIEYS